MTLGLGDSLELPSAMSLWGAIKLGDPLMCRWIAYLGQPVFIDEFVTAPRQSLVAQSRHSREAKTEVNADGFGIGWYGERTRPGLFRDIRPAWSDDNLLSIAHQIRAGLFLAHVRASTGSATTRANCHPFAAGSWLFMHNGQIGGWERLRRQIEMMIPDELFPLRGGTTDSEALFLIMLANGLDRDAQSACTLTLAQIEDLMVRTRITEPLRFTAAFSNGRELYAVRYASDRRPPTLYTKTCGGKGSTLIVSEPLDEVRDGWVEVPQQSFVTVTERGAELAALPVVRGGDCAGPVKDRGDLRSPLAAPA